MNIVKIKVTKKQPVRTHKSFTLRLRVEICDQLDGIAEKSNGYVSRQKLVERIVEQVLKDPKFVLELD